MLEINNFKHINKEFQSKQTDFLFCQVQQDMANQVMEKIIFIVLAKIKMLL